MDGPFHYSEAERLLGALSKVVLQNDGSSPEATLMLAEANVHATLALAAATALNDSDGGMPVHDWNAWHATAGTLTNDEPGQVEPAPAAQVRIDSLFAAVKDHDVMVSRPGWNDGKPVELVELQGRFDGYVEVAYGLPETQEYRKATVPADTLVTPYGGAQ